ncbi:MAG: YcfL family protein [Azoarcus sp.]|jgi:hypothetical protein|nr:YcfL family protein [Azoarcus sp.]
MKRIAMMVALGLACAGTFPPLHAEESGAIASKVEELGTMDHLRVVEIRAARRDNLLRVQFTVANTSPSNEQLHYRLRWLDNDGFTVWEEEPWKPEIIYGKQDKVIHAVAPTFKAADFKLEVQSPRNSTVRERQPPASTADNPPYR